MDRNEVIATLQANAPELRRLGVRHAALFGSLARGEAQSDSDIDIFIEFEPEAPIDLFEYAGIKRYIAELFIGPVDVVDRDALKPYLRAPVKNDAIYAF